jgi:hypothetical protein
MPPDIPTPQDIAYPGTIKLSVDATDVTRGIFRVHEIIPVRAGPLTLLYPKWLPGNHAPNGTLDKFAGLVIRAGGKVIPWTRDVVDVFAFHIDVPEGVAGNSRPRSSLRPAATPPLSNLCRSTRSSIRP